MVLTLFIILSSSLCQRLSLSLSGNLSFSSIYLQPYRVLSELLQRLHVTDRHGLQRLLPPVLWFAGTFTRCKSQGYTYTNTIMLIASFEI